MADKSMKIKDYYINTFEDDELGQEINPDITFEEVYNALKDNKGDNIYDIIGVGDSIIRERIFDALSQIYNVDYDDIYYMWLGRFDKVHFNKLTEDVCDDIEYGDDMVENLWAAVCCDDTIYVKNSFNKQLVPVNTRYERFGKKNSLIMGALRNGNFDMVKLLRQFGETILQSELEEYKMIMAKRTYEDDITKSAKTESLEPKKITLSKINDMLYKSHVDSVYRDEFANLEKELGFLPDTPFNMYYGGEESKKELINLEEKPLTDEEVEKIVVAFLDKMYNDYQFNDLRDFAYNLIGDKADKYFDSSMRESVETSNEDKFYGIDDIEFNWHGEWASPTITYKGLEFYAEDLEDIMYNDYEEVVDDNEFDGTFEEYMELHAEDSTAILEELAPLGVADYITNEIQYLNIEDIIPKLNSYKETTIIPNKILDKCIKLVEYNIGNEDLEEMPYDDYYALGEQTAEEVIEFLENNMTRNPISFS